MSPQEDLPAFRTQLSGVHRSNTNPRPHSSSKPYSRPLHGTSPEKEQNGTPGGGRPGMVKSHSSSTLSRSGSEPSLFSGLKSMLSRPIAWLTTPSKQNLSPTRGGTTGTTGKKRDNYASFGADLEDAPSPSGAREGKRARQVSPPRQRGVGAGAYEPDHISIMGQAVTGTMLPPLSPGMSLSAKNRNSALHRDTNFSRPLASSKSMPYLDPPTSALSPGRRGIAKSPMTRSRRTDLHRLANEEIEESHPMPEPPTTDSWSPWKDRYRNSMTPRAQTPGRTGERDFALPSLSPFKAPPPHTSTGSLVRSATVGSHLRRASSVATDVSMGAPESPRFQRRSLHSTVPEAHEDDQMSIDGDRQDGSVLVSPLLMVQGESHLQDWVMRDRWSGVPGSPASVAASRRLGSVTPSVVGAPPIRKGQLVWAGEKGFVRESELETRAPLLCRVTNADQTAEPHKPVPRNEAEAILYALESSRNTPVAAARASTSSLPASLIGSSSREIRKAINVPMATAQAGESARKRRDRDRLGEDHNVMISPYGRRQQVDRAVRDVQRARSSSAMEQDRAMSRSPSAISSASSQQDQLSLSEREQSATPVPAPRRSSRLKRASSPLPEETPQPHRRTRKTSASLKDANIESTTPRATPSRKRRSTQDKPSSPPPAVPPFPTIIETAASPDQKSSYAPRADGDLPKGSLRAKSDVTKRTHSASASYNNSRATSPSGGRFSAKEEDLPNMDELENQPKISLGGFTGFNFTPPATAPTPAAEQKSAPSQSSGSGRSSLVAPSNSGRPNAGPLSRLNASRPRAPSPLASSVVAAPGSPDSSTTSEPKPAENGLGFFPMSSKNSGSTMEITKPALFAGVSTDKGDKDGRPAKRTAIGLGKPSAPEPKDTETNGEMPDFFGMKSKTATPAASEPSSGAASPPTFNFGTSKPATPAEPVKPAASSGGFNFGIPTSKPAEAPTNGGFSFGASKPAESSSAAPTFSFGKKDDAPKPASTSSFSFGKSAASTDADAAEKSKPAFSFGTPSAAEPKPADSSTPKPAFSFGTPATKSTDKPVEAPKPAFSFGTPSAKPADKLADTAKPAFAFGTPAKTDEAKAPATAAPASSAPFSFGSSTAPKADEGKTDAAKPSTTFSFGSAATKPAEDTPKPAVSFGAPSKAGEEPKSSGFSFGATTKPAEEPKSTGFSFGATSSTAKPAETPKSPPPGDKPAFSFGASSKPAETAKPAFSFGSTTSTTDVPKTDSAKPAFSFGAPASSSTPSTGFSFGAKPTSPPKAASNPFASSTTPSTGGFNFGSTTPAASPFATKTDAPSNPFSSTTSTDAPKSNPFTSPPAASAASSNPFSTPTSPSAAPAPATGGFSFGQASSSTANGSSAPAPFTFGAGATKNPPPPYSATSGGFGAAQSTTPAAAPSFNFGASATPNSGGFGTSNGFGSSSNTTNAFGASPANNTNAAGGFNFTFGGTASANSSAPSTPFVFGAGQPTTPGGAPAASPFGTNTTPSQPTFAFGQSATTPNANPVATGFSFGSSAPANGGVRFASPAPESGGGFSLGTGGEGTPGSPGGRQIKPLRKPRR